VRWRGEITKVGWNQDGLWDRVITIEQKCSKTAG
jgi:hypothetical protein